MQSKPELEETTAREKEYLDLLQRTQADFINYKRQVEQEREEQVKFAKAELILKLLPILDDFTSSFQFCAWLDKITEEAIWLGLYKMSEQ